MSVYAVVAVCGRLSGTASSGGKVAASIAFPEQPASDVTDITRSGEALVLSYELDSPQGLIPMTVTLTPDGEGLTAAFDFGGQFQAEGSAERVGG